MLDALAAIVAADIAGYSRLIGMDEEGTVRALQEHQSALFPLIRESGGVVINTAGDSILAEFGSVVGAVRAAVAAQQLMAVRNHGIPAPRQLEFRIGVNQGEIIADRNDVYGDGINVASRREESQYQGAYMRTSPESSIFSGAMPANKTSRISPARSAFGIGRNRRIRRSRILHLRTSLRLRCYRSTT